MPVRGIARGGEKEALRCGMETFVHSISSVMIILMLTAVGYFCGARHWMGQETKAFIGRFLLSLAVPCMCIYSLKTSVDRDMLEQSGKMLLTVFLCSALSFLAAYIFARLLRVPRRRFGPFLVMCALSNSMFVGAAMCTELFGESSMPYVMLYFCISTGFTQTVGMGLIRWSGTNDSGFSPAMFAKLLKLPTIWGVVIGYLLVLADIDLPPLVMAFGKYMNGVVTPLALLLTGYIIYEIGLKNLRADRILTAALIFRFLLAPALCWMFCLLLGVDGLGRSVFVVESAMPVVTQAVVASSEYGADEQFAAQGAAVSTLACFVVIPVLMMLL